MGNVLDGTFDTELQKKFASTGVTTISACHDCWAKFYCGGGCRASAHLLTGAIDKPHKLTCQLIKKRIECAIALITARADIDGIL